MKKIAIIIPTYNRAHLLEKTIPTYVEQFGENFKITEVIVVDDYSSDNTIEILENLKEKYSIIKYYKLEKNSRQQVAKNKGIELLGANIDYVYFGDDDAVLIPNSIKYLVETLENYDADLVGARALYAKSIEEIKSYEKVKIDQIRNNEIINFEKDFFSFDQQLEIPICVPVTTAYFLIRREHLFNYKFDERYTNNCYREETDFILQLTKNNKKVMLDTRAVGINYPRFIATGGAHKKGILGKLIWYYWAIINNSRFLDKNYDFLKEKNYVQSSKNILKIKFIFIQGKRFLKSGIKKLKAKVK